MPRHKYLKTETICYLQLAFAQQIFGCPLVQLHVPVRLQQVSAAASSCGKSRTWSNARPVLLNVRPTGFEDHWKVNRHNAVDKLCLSLSRGQIAACLTTPALTLLHVILYKYRGPLDKNCLQFGCRAGLLLLFKVRMISSSSKCTHSARFPLLMYRFIQTTSNFGLTSSEGIEKQAACTPALAANLSEPQPPGRPGLPAGPSVTPSVEAFAVRAFAVQ